MSDNDEVLLRALATHGFDHPSFVAEGSSAEVYSAIDRENRLVAIKVLKEELAVNDDARAQFLATTQRVAKLCTDKPNDRLVPILETGAVEGRPYLVMPYAAGGSLKDRLEASEFQTEQARRATASVVASVLAEGLSLVHAAGLVHRDVKPSNVLIFANGLGTSSRRDGLDLQSHLTPDESLRLGDFGLATSYNELSYHGRLPAGTPGYAGPETLSANPDWTPKADIYSATICIIETLLGSRPGHNWPDELLKTGHSKQLVAELRVGTENDPSQRHSSIDTWGERIQVALNRQGSSGRRSIVFAAMVAAIVFAASGGWALSVYAPMNEPNPVATPAVLLDDNVLERCEPVTGEACATLPQIVVRVTNQLELEIDHDGIGDTYHLEVQGEIVDVTEGGQFSYGALRYPSATDPDPHQRWTAEPLSLRVWACAAAGCVPSAPFEGQLGESDGQGADATCLLNTGQQEAQCLIRDTNETSHPAGLEALDTSYTCDEQAAGFVVPDAYAEDKQYLACQVFFADVDVLEFRAVGRNRWTGTEVFGPLVSLAAP